MFISFFRKVNIPLLTCTPIIGYKIQNQDDNIVQSMYCAATGLETLIFRIFQACNLCCVLEYVDDHASRVNVFNAQRILLTMTVELASIFVIPVYRLVYFITDPEDSNSANELDYNDSLFSSILMFVV